MLSSMAVQSCLPNASFLSQKPSFRPTTMFQTSNNLVTPQIFHHQKKTKPISVNRKFVALASPETLTAEPDAVNGDSDSTLTTQEVIKVVVNQEEKPRLVLKFIWMEKNIGLALDQVVPGHGTIPLSPYFFWPRKDAWEELKSTLESKPWISQKKMIILLNQATDIINLWQQSGGNLTSQ
ncbi:PREDICTED: 30S ribosomal protein 3-1, chloroplastic [Tarenaya hassleriana]|uniref:30S ribosomal protein 3-1, chloroplastic n=1 Tax=Tarenaya hassleriana TaxID=28532 RepID=UPI00053C5F78|nr:PREDICTED: 30S ribosomal protein 3-1, chloroplastic [Tarenaya hassleriana]